MHTDFIFSAIAEEFGLIGAVFVLMAYALLFWRGIQIALRQARMEETLLAAGAAVALLLQAFIIVAGVTGITLPFVSYGGSSMAASFVFLGILTALSAPRKEAAS